MLGRYLARSYRKKWFHNLCQSLIFRSCLDLQPLTSNEHSLMCGIKTRQNQPLHFCENSIFTDIHSEASSVSSSQFVFQLLLRVEMSYVVLVTNTFSHVISPSIKIYLRDKACAQLFFILKMVTVSCEYLCRENLWYLFLVFTNRAKQGNTVSGNTYKTAYHQFLQIELQKYLVVGKPNTLQPMNIMSLHYKC